MILVGSLETNPGIFLGELVETPGQSDLIGSHGFHNTDTVLPLLDPEGGVAECCLLYTSDAADE